MKYLLIPILFISAFSFSQNKEYHFDYFLEYEMTFHKEDISRPKYYLTNSKDNSYLGIMKELDSLNLELTFKHYDKIYAKVSFLKSAFFKAEFINIECKSVRENKNPFKYQTKNYDFHILKDTVVNNNIYSAYKLQSNLKLKKRIRKGISTNHYIIDNSTSFHLPILQHPTAYEEWELNKILPNGIFYELTFVTPLNERHSSEILKSYHKIDKKVVIIGKCYKPRKIKLPHQNTSSLH